MSALQTWAQVPTEQFSRPTYGRGRAVRGGQLALLVVPTGVAALVYITKAELLTGGPLLTATSILTGFTFSMAVVFWNRSIDARRDSRWSGDAQALDTLDVMRTHLIFTVMVGVATCAVGVLFEIFSNVLVAFDLFGYTWHTRVLATALLGAMSSYLFVLVATALAKFQQAFYLLKR